MNALLRQFVGLAVLLVGLGSVAAAADDAPFIAHEWGTFTALQNDAGESLPGINIDDEPVPPFVHNLAPLLLNNPILSSDHWGYRQKGAPRQHPMVTMRLETPVIYFYPGADGLLPSKVDVDVAFRGGWLTEFYPYAKATMPGLEDVGFNFGALTPTTLGGLTWKDVRLNTREAGPKTDDKVWLAPRQVKAVDVSVHNPGNENVEPADEHERYLFYRGVANQHAPLSVTTNLEKQELTLRANFQDVPGKKSHTIDGAWLVDIRDDGRVAYRTLPTLKADADPKRVIGTTSRTFSEGDFDRGNFDQLREDMHAALVSDGLFADEATAMLSTWERAYFQTPGLRLFFLVPEAWTNHYLPLTISGAPQVTRVMMGRIELISDAQRKLFPKLGEGIADASWIEKIPEGPAREKFMAGRSNFGDLGVKIPANYQAYLALGRFRNALVIAEAKRKPSENLERFVSAYSIRPYKWAR